MATLNTSVPNIIDEAKRTLGAGPSMEFRVAELLAERNPVVRTAYFMPSSKPKAHAWQVRTGLPGTTRRRFNEGIRPTKSRTAQLEMKLGNIFGYFEFDYHMARSSGNIAAYFENELVAMHQSVAQRIAKDVFYGNQKTDPSAWDGLALNYSDPSSKNGGQLISGKGTANKTDCRSIWAVCWGPRKAAVVYDRSQPMGVEVVDPSETDRGTYWKDNAPVRGGGNSDGRIEVMGRQLSFYGGVCVEDPRYVARAHSISIGELKGDGASGPNLVRMCRALINRIEPSSGDGRLVLYMPRGLIEVLKSQEIDGVKNSTLDIPNLYRTGLDGMTIDGIPVYREDALDVDENTIN